MFENEIPKIKEEINLSDYNKFSDKFFATYSYAKIRQVFLEVENPEDLKKIPVAHLKVINLVIPLGSLSYANTVLKECYKILSDEVIAYIRGDDDFDNITDTLKLCIEKCNEAADEHNIEDVFSFDQSLVFKVYKNKKWHQVSFQYLHWPKQYLYLDFKEHFNIRKSFFHKLGKSFDKVLKIHLSKPPAIKKPYTWISENPELEITELLYIIYRTSGQLVIDVESGGSFSKFKRDFFNLFGLSDKSYDKKVKQIRERKRGDHLIIKLAEKFKKDHAKLFEIKK